MDRGAALALGMQLISSKVPELFAHYGLELQADTDLSKAWPALCMRLAMDFVPGFEIRLRNVKGAKKKSDGFGLYRKVMEHKRKAEAKGALVSDIEACYAVASKLRLSKATAHRKFKAFKTLLRTANASVVYVDGYWDVISRIDASDASAPLGIWSD